MENMVSQNLDLTKGRIMPLLLKLATPIVMTSFLLTAYSLVDMIWVGKLGYRAVSAVGTAGYYMWLASGIVYLTKIGGEIAVSQAYGSKNERDLQNYAKASVQLSIICSVVYMLILLVFARPLILFFKIPTPIVNDWAVNYLMIVALGMPAMFVTMTITGVYCGIGDSKTPLYMSGIGLILNAVLDPILIFGWFGMPKLGVEGAALATTLSLLIEMALFLIHFKSKRSHFRDIKLISKPDFSYMRKISKLGLPVTIESVMFTVFSSLIARSLSFYGDIPLSVQKVGTQIESISWMTAEGFQAAICAFIGQNFGARKFDRIADGYNKAMSVICSIGIFASVIFYLFPAELFSIFISDPEIVPYGASYLKIISLSQLLLVIDISTAGAFRGMGKTFPPSFVSILFTGLRVPLVYFVVANNMPLDAIWWIITITAGLKGIVTGLWYQIWFRSYRKVYS